MRCQDYSVDSSKTKLFTEEILRVRFLFYKHERTVSSACMKLGELLDLITRCYPGAQILGLEPLDTAADRNRSDQEPRKKSYGYEQNVYSDPVSVN